VQYLDLGEIQNGVLRREERFGYLELATSSKLDPRDFIPDVRPDERPARAFVTL
jgi:hypothetical protein